MVGEVARGDTSVEHLVELTLSQKAAAAFHREWHAAGNREPLLDLRDVHVGSRVRGVDLTIRRGETVTVSGLLGSGQDRLARAVAGDVPDVTGTFVLKGHETIPARRVRPFASGSPSSLKTGRRRALPGHAGAGEHQHRVTRALVFGRLLRIIDRRKEHDSPRRRSVDRDRTALLADGPCPLQRQPAEVAARALVIWRADLLVLVEPTRGVDVGAKLEIYRELRSSRGGAPGSRGRDRLPEAMAYPTESRFSTRAASRPSSIRGSERAGRDARDPGRLGRTRRTHAGAHRVNAEATRSASAVSSIVASPPTARAARGDIGILAIAGVLLLAFGLTSSQFLVADNIRNIFVQISVVGVAAIGETIVMSPQVSTCRSVLSCC